MPSGSRFRTLFSPNPADPTRSSAPAAEPARDRRRRRRRARPRPLALHAGAALPRARRATRPERRRGSTSALAAPVERARRSSQLAYEPRRRRLPPPARLRGPHARRRRVRGAARSSSRLGVADPYDGLAPPPRRPRRARRRAARRRRARRPAWWSEPIFCGWGAQCRLADSGRRRIAGDYATQANYDAFLDAARGATASFPGRSCSTTSGRPPTARTSPTRRSGPTSRGWIADRHARGQRVLLWWKAWDPEGLAARALRPQPRRRAASRSTRRNPATRELRCATMRRTRCSAPDGLDADGLKVDFTARTPERPRAHARTEPAGESRSCTSCSRVVYAAAKEAKPDALVITHTPHPGVRRRHRHDPAERHGRRRRRVASCRRCATAPRSRARPCPELLIDTDDWRDPDLARVARVPRGEAVARRARRSTTPTRSTRPARRSSPRTTTRCARTWAAWRSRAGERASGRRRVEPPRARSRWPTSRARRARRRRPPRARSAAAATSRRSRASGCSPSAERLGYVPNASARTLKQQTSRVVGVAVSDLGNQFYARLAAGIEQTLREADYQMVLVSDNSDRAQELACARTFLAMRAAGRDHDARPTSDAAALLARTASRVVEVDRRLADVAVRRRRDRQRARRAATRRRTCSSSATAASACSSRTPTGRATSGRLRGYRAAHARCGRRRSTSG